MAPLFATLIASATFRPCAAADDKPAAPPAARTDVVRLTIHPAGEPLPTLKYRLLPSFYERQSGNAAPLYAKALFTLGNAEMHDQRRKSLLDGPPADCTSEAVAELLPETVSNLIRFAAVRDRCDWELPLREQSAFEVALPEAREMRRLATFVCLQARVYVNAGRFDDAVSTLARAYAMARHVAETPTLVTGLVAQSIQATADKVLLETVARPGAPNLYWALAVLPRPLIDARPGFEAEMHMLDLSFRGWTDLAREPPSDDAVAELFRQYASLVPSATVDGRAAPDAGRLRATILAAFKTAAHKREVQDYVVRAGWARADVEKLADLQLAAVHARLKFDELRDLMFRWSALPYGQAKAGLLAAEKRLREAESSGEERIPLASLLVPAVRQVRVAHARGERRLDVVRVIEALRMYAATHDGRLPTTLDDVQTATPLPLDAVTGKPFDYKLDGVKALLTLADEKDADGEMTRVYEIFVGR